MKLNKTNPQTEVDFDMTPMIDCVFQLIIFFMLITDMSQKELETLILPVAVTASPDDPDPSIVRPVINILADGSILVMGELKYDPLNDDGYLKVKAYLEQQAKLMPKKPVEEGSTTIAPDNPVLVRADQSTPFKHIQKVMELCGQKGIQIWKIQLAAAEADESGARKPQKR